MKRLLVVLALLSAVVAVAQPSHPPRVVRVVGTAEVKVIPDRVTLVVGTQKVSPVAATAKSGVDSVSKALIAAIRKNGVETKDIKTASLSLQPQFDFKNGRKFSHFLAQQDFVVTVRDLSRLDAILDAVITSGANEIDSIQYETSELRKYRDQAREEAVKAAREKADALARSLGQQIGKAYSIEEAPEYNYQWSGGVMANAFAYNGPSSDGQGETSTAPGEKTIRSSVTVAFDLF